MKPPIVYEETKPRSQRIIRTIATVSSICLPPRGRLAAVGIIAPVVRDSSPCRRRPDSTDAFFELIDDLFHLLLELSRRLISLPPTLQLLVAGECPGRFLHTPLQFVRFSARHDRSSCPGPTMVVPVLDHAHRTRCLSSLVAVAFISSAMYI